MDALLWSVTASAGVVPVFDCTAGCHDAANIVATGGADIGALSTLVDREAIYRAIVNLDDVVNYCKSAEGDMDVMLRGPDPHPRAMSRAFLTAATALHNGFGRLGNDTANAARDAESARNAEHRVEKLSRAELTDLCAMQQPTCMETQCLHTRPAAGHGELACMTRGRLGWLCLQGMTLSFTTTCRF